MKKIILWVVGVIVVILIIIFFLGLYGEKMQNYFLMQRQERLILEGEKRAAEILEIQKADNYGGKTPEETLDLYIQALKAGDIELASKYYEISLDNMELQAKHLDSLKDMIARDDSLDIVIENVGKIKNLGKKTIWSESEVSFVYKFTVEKELISTSTVSREQIITVIPAGTILDMGKSLRLNSYTKIWKIIQ